MPSKSWWNGTVVKEACCQVRWSEFNSGNPHGKRELIPKGTPSHVSLFTCKHTHNTFLKVFLIPPQLCFILAHPEILSCDKAKHPVSLEWSFLKDKEVLSVLPVVTVWINKRTGPWESKSKAFFKVSMAAGYQLPGCPQEKGNQSCQKESEFL